MHLKLNIIKTFCTSSYLLYIISSNRPAEWQRWERIVLQGCWWLKLRQRKTGEGTDQCCEDCFSLKTIRISAAVPSIFSDIGLSSWLFVEWLKKASEEERLMEEAAAVGVTAESESTITEIGVGTTFVGVGVGRFNSVTSGWQTVSAVALPTLKTLPWHLERHRKRERERTRH